MPDTKQSKQKHFESLFGRTESWSRLQVFWLQDALLCKLYTNLLHIKQCVGRPKVLCGNRSTAVLAGVWISYHHVCFVNVFLYFQFSFADDMLDSCSCAFLDTF